MYHEPVLLKESLDMLRLRAEGTYVDATFGGGGHARHLLENLSGKGRLYAFDQDEDARNNALKPPFADNPCFVFVPANFRHLKRMLRSEGVDVGTVDGILADLGVSSYQIDTAERGFSYRFDAPLDMRMNNRDGNTAADVLQKYSADELQRVFSELGEVRNARTLARAVLHHRETGQLLKTTGELVGLCDKNLMGERWRYLSQVFQSLRMEVNDELGALTDFLKDAHEMLAPGGRLVVITYHSLEDRLVKNYIKTGNVEGNVVQDFYGNIERPFEITLKKPLEASETEIKSNPRARSARLRVAEKHKT